MDFLTYAASIFFEASHLVGTYVVALIKYVLPMARDVEILIDPIGYMCLLTVFVVVTTVVRKVSIVILIVGWLLIILRVIAATLQVG